MVIRNNRIQSVNGAHRADNAAICTSTRWPAGATAYPLYRNILVEKNRFIDPTGPALSLRNCQDVVLRDNLIQSAEVSSNAPFAAAILAAYTANLQLNANRWEVNPSAIPPGVYYDPESTAHIEVFHNVKVQPPAAP